jgi:beta-1,4-mannooligosaccharide phosphorylase
LPQIPARHCDLGLKQEGDWCTNAKLKSGIPVYACGALLHNGELMIPYGRADHATGFATVSLEEVLAAMH